MFGIFQRQAHYGYFQVTSNGDISPVHSTGSLSDQDHHDHVMLTDLTLNNDCQEECIIQEIDKGISFLADTPSKQQQQSKQPHQPPPQQQQQLIKPPQQQQQQQQQQQKIIKATPIIKSENRQAQPCGMKSTILPQIKNEQSINAPTQCMVIPSNIQQTDQKPVLVQNVQALKLPLPRNAKQNPIFIQQVNGSIPLIPVTTTQPQVQTVNLVSSTHSPVLKPGMFMDRHVSHQCFHVYPLSGNIVVKTKFAFHEAKMFPNKFKNIW